MHCLYSGYNLHRFSDALGLVFVLPTITIFSDFEDSLHLSPQYNQTFWQHTYLFMYTKNTCTFLEFYLVFTWLDGQQEGQTRIGQGVSDQYNVI